jgi:type I restriction-modification system DNA methylase subunit
VSSSYQKRLGFANLLNLPEGADIGKAINEAMKSIEADNEDLTDVLPKTYNALEKGLLVSLLKNFSAIPITEGDAQVFNGSLTKTYDEALPWRIKAPDRQRQETYQEKTR